MEDDGGQRLGKLADRRSRERGRLDDRSQCVALAAALHAEQADRVRLVEIKRDCPAEVRPGLGRHTAGDAWLVPRKMSGARPGAAVPAGGTSASVSVASGSAASIAASSSGEGSSTGTASCLLAVGWLSSPSAPVAAGSSEAAPAEARSISSSVNSVGASSGSSGVLMVALGRAERRIR